jgi:phage tail-like protein
VYGEVSYFSLNKKSDWEKGWADNFHFSNEGIALKTSRQYAISRVVRVPNMDASADIIDIAMGRYGVFYLLDASANIWVYDYGNQQTDIFIKSGHGLFTGQSAITVLNDIVLLADPLGGQKLIAFSAANGQILWTVNEIDNASLLPLALASDGRQSFYAAAVLDTARSVKPDNEISGEASLGIIQLNMSGQIINKFQHVDCKLEQAAKVQRLQYSIFVGVSQSNNVCMINCNIKTAYCFSDGGASLARFSTGTPARPSGLIIDVHNNIYIGDSGSPGNNAEDGRFIHKLQAGGQYLETVPGFRGRTDKLFTDDENRIYSWNRESSTLSVLELKEKISGTEGLGLPRGTYLSASLDSTVEEMNWHKILLEADVPDNTQIIISYFCSDYKEVLIDGKISNLDELIKDQSLSGTEKKERLAALWSRPIINPGDALLHGAKGRYLWLKIDFVSSGDKTPVLKKIRIYYPRMSFLSYLPSVYQEDEKSRDFLERYLALYESFFVDMEEKIGGIAQYFDADAVSGPFLKWLATWFAIVVDDSWGEEQLRNLLKRAPELYKRRGTKRAMEDLIEIYTGQKPFIVEYFQFKHLKDNPELKDLLLKLYSMDPYCFTVLVKQECVATEQRRLAVQKILDEEKPAFTEARLVVLQPWIYMDMHTYLGINTFLSELTLLHLDHKSTIPFNTVLVDVDMDNRLGLHSRMEIDSEVKY